MSRGVIHTAEAEKTGIDMYMGQGGAPEGVLAAAALKCMGGQIYGRLIFNEEDERERARKIGITDFDRVYALDELVRDDVIFAANWGDRWLGRAGRVSRGWLYHDRDDFNALAYRLGSADLVSAE